MRRTCAAAFHEGRPGAAAEDEVDRTPAVEVDVVHVHLLLQDLQTVLFYIMPVLLYVSFISEVR